MTSRRLYTICCTYEYFLEKPLFSLPISPLEYSLVHEKWFEKPQDRWLQKGADFLGSEGICTWRHSSQQRVMLSILQTELFQVCSCLGNLHAVEPSLQPELLDHLLHGGNARRTQHGARDSRADSSVWAGGGLYLLFKDLILKCLNLKKKTVRHFKLVKCFILWCLYVWSQGWERKENLWLNSDVSLCQTAKGSVVLSNFVSTWHKLESSDRKEPQLRKMTYSWIS